MKELLGGLKRRSMRISNIYQQGYPLKNCDPYETLHVTHDQRCSIDLTNLADIFTVGRPNKVRKKLKISAQTNHPFWIYDPPKYEGICYFWANTCL
jgi:hypothetical protein